MLNRLYRLTWFPLVLQILSLVVFFALMLGGFWANTDDMAFAKVLRNTNLANLIVWSYWWPLIVIAAACLGRVWCMVCPIELITSLISRVGLKYKVPAFARSGWVITMLFVAILFVGIHTLGVHRVPLRMALYLSGLFIAAVLCALVFSRHAFCAYVCPVGHLLGLYARLAPMGWGVQDKGVCTSCRDRSCTSHQCADNIVGHSCGVGLRPATIKDNSRCLLCGHCLKACDHHNPGSDARPNPGWFRRPWFKDLLELYPLTMAQALFCLIVSGFVIYEIFTEWSASKNLLLWLPAQVERSMGISGGWGHGLVSAILLFALLPALLWLLPYGLFRLLGGRLALRQYLLRYSIAFIPIMAAAHMVKALLKMTSRIPYWQYVADDPMGLDTARRIREGTLSLSALPFWRDGLITVTAIGLLLGALWLSVVITKKLIAAQRHGLAGWAFYGIPGIYGLGFVVMVVWWRLFS